MNIGSVDNIYFLGIGGIGMSNLARYFISLGKTVGGYDRTSTPLTQKLQSEGAFVHYDDAIDSVPPSFIDKGSTLIIYTPAIPKTHKVYNYFVDNGFTLIKRAEALGKITSVTKAICCAGTHGKTTVSSMIAHLLRQSHIDCNAFLGGILRNYDSNLLLSETSEYSVVEADEYDRSFHWLHPFIATITSADPDHLDIYHTAEAYRESFERFTSLILPNGYLLMKKDIPLTPMCDSSVTIFTYSVSEGDFYAKNIVIEDGEIYFDFVSRYTVIEKLHLGVPAIINIENAVVAIATALLCGVREDEIRLAISNMQGVKRRFEVRIKSPEVVFIDDYAHHPEELDASISSIRKLYEGKRITGVFQPHLFSRTADFKDEFAEKLSMLDDIILLDIYPARELPIEGVTSQIVFDNITSKRKTLCTKENLLKELEEHDFDVLVTLGAGDIDQLLPEIDCELNKRFNLK